MTDSRQIDDYNDPELQNSEQDDEAAQAQTLVDEEMKRGLTPGELGIGGETVHGGRTDPGQLIPDDEQDLVDHMSDMVRSGRIDMDAFAGEPESMDDEDGSVPD